MMKSKYQDRLLVLLTLVLFVTMVFFDIDFVSFFARPVNAAAVTWDGGGGDLDWCTDANWSNDQEPTSADDVTLSDGALLDATTSGCVTEGKNLNFSTLTIGDGINANNLIMEAGIGTGGDITITNASSFIQNNSSTISITGDLTINSGGTLTHSENVGGDAAYWIDIRADNVDVQAGGVIGINGRGFTGGGAGANGNGPGGGVASGSDGSGAGHGGEGGSDLNGGQGGIPYCNISSPASMGSGGGGPTNGTGGDGGGFVLLTVTTTFTMNGILNADGAMGTSGGSNRDGGGGAGGGVKIVAGTVAGTPQSFTSNGANSVDSGDDGSEQGGGGGGGCIYVEYTNTTSFYGTDVEMWGGSGNQYGGAGVALFKKTNGTDSRLYAINTSTLGAITPQVTNSLSVDSLTVSDMAVYVVSSTNSLTLDDASPFSGGDGTGKVSFRGSSTFTPNTSLTVASTTLELYETSVLTSSSTWDMIIAQDATTTLYGFTTTTALSVDTITVQSGGVLTHVANPTSTPIHALNVSATSITVNAGGVISVNNRGYDNSGSDEDGFGPGKGIYGNSDGSGAGHGGAGGANLNADAGGAVYCSSTNPLTTGSSGGGATLGAGGAGGGLAILNITDTLTIAGSLTADGENGTAGAGGSRDGGGGAGGGVKITTKDLTLSGSLTSDGGDSADTGGDLVYEGGGGGGGCVYIDYSGSLNVAGATTSTSGGTGNVNGDAGTFVWVASNSAPSVTAITPSQVSSTMVLVTTTIADVNSNKTNLTVEYSTNGTTWASSTLGSVSQSGEGDGVTTSTGYIESIDTDNDGSVDLEIKWDISADIPNMDTSTAYVRIKPNDGILQSSLVVSAAFAADTAMPTRPGPLTMNTTSSVSVLLNLGTTSTESNFSQYKLFYAESTPISESDTEINSSTMTRLGNIDFQNFTTGTISGLSSDTRYYANIWSYDTWLYSTSSLQEVSFYTYAATPAAPTVNGATPITLNVTVNDGGTNPAATTYAIYLNSNGQFANNWVAANGGLEASEVWLTLAQWGTVTVGGLSENTSYSFSAKARNQDLVTTALGSSASGTTTNAPDPVPPDADGDGGADGDEDPDPPPECKGPNCALGGDIDGYIVINDNDEYAASKEVVLDLYFTTFVTQYRAVEAENVEGIGFLCNYLGVGYDLTGGSNPTDDPDYRTIEAPFTLSANSGEKQICVDYAGSVDGEMQQHEAADDIILSEVGLPTKISFDSGMKDGVKIHGTPKLTGGIDKPDDNMLDAAFVKLRNSSIPGDEYKSASVVGDNWTYTFKTLGIESSVILLNTGLNLIKAYGQSLDGVMGNEVTIELTVPPEGGDEDEPPPGDDNDEPIDDDPADPVDGGDDDPADPVDGGDDDGGAPVNDGGGGQDGGGQDGSGPISSGEGNVPPASVPIEEEKVDVVEEEVVEKEEVKVIAIIIEAPKKVIKAVKKVIDNPKVEKANERVAAPVMVAAGVANVAIGFSLPQILAFLRSIFAEPLLLLRLRKRKKWGVIYNAFNKQPLDLVVIRLVDAKTDRVVSSQVTDSQGRYLLVAEPGEYRLEVDKQGFAGFSEHLREADEDGSYLNLYHGTVINVMNENTSLTQAIPLDPVGEEVPTSQVLRDHTKRRIHKIVGIVGLMASVVSLAISPTALIFAIFFLHLLFYSLAHRFAHAKLPDSWGVVREILNEKPLGKVVVRVFDSAYNKLVDTGVTDRKGRYAVLVGPSKYYVTYEKPAFRTKKSPEIDFSSKKTEGMGGLIDRSEKMSRLKKKVVDDTEIDKPA